MLDGLDRNHFQTELARISDEMMHYIDVFIESHINIYDDGNVITVTFVAYLGDRGCA